MTAIVAAAQTWVSGFTTAAKTTLYIAVGWGEVAGQTLAANALGESMSAGYLTNYSTVTSALASHGGHSFTASNEPTTAQFFMTSAEAKALGLVSGTGGSASSPDGYIGFMKSTTGWSFSPTVTGSSQYNLQSVADHEITEIMGRIGMEGTQTFQGQKTYTPLDLFNYSAQGTLILSGAGGYFSANGGVTHQGNYNSINGADIADWASYNSPNDSGTLTDGGDDSFNAFGRQGYNLELSADDLLEVAALGYLKI
jgi:hypothetical protein